MKRMMSARSESTGYHKSRLKRTDASESINTLAATDVSLLWLIEAAIAGARRHRRRTRLITWTIRGIALLFYLWPGNRWPYSGLLLGLISAALVDVLTSFGFPGRRTRAALALIDTLPATDSSVALARLLDAVYPHEASTATIRAQLAAVLVRLTPSEIAELPAPTIGTLKRSALLSGKRHERRTLALASLLTLAYRVPFDPPLASDPFFAGRVACLRRWLRVFARDDSDFALAEAADEWKHARKWMV